MPEQQACKGYEQQIKRGKQKCRNKVGEEPGHDDYSKNVCLSYCNCVLVKIEGEVFV
jgi:hypothetical protein